jgi:hypothetical protein
VCLGLAGLPSTKSVSGKSLVVCGPVLKSVFSSHTPLTCFKAEPTSVDSQRPGRRDLL